MRSFDRLRDLIANLPLEPPESAAVLGVPTTVFDSVGRTVLVVDAALPGRPHEPEDAHAR